MVQGLPNPQNPAKAGPLSKPVSTPGSEAAGDRDVRNKRNSLGITPDLVCTISGGSVDELW